MPEIIVDDAAVSEALKAAAGEVLETMFFATIEEEPMGGEDDPQLAVRVRFQGTPSGMFSLEIGESAARTIALDFLGESADDLSHAQICQVLCELANMICGATLSHIGSETQFEISSPEVTAAGGHDASTSVRRSMYLSDGTLTLWMVLGRIDADHP